ncbi:tRNA uracil 4-sulfurtransferase ThiI [uncultured Parolsenella sp.]|uniref:tRNA uracil 4-sulfurtransferase ThiI n=1 Tax=uncultured Parolsenella sp. TaxID=2083008 RepID=UPI0025CD963B|nr:tRNA uracil 4-sulfurtransferase ThiI [uncultured Parolsenella sp.]
MADRVCLVHYHEIGLKGKNRSIFERQLITNLKRALKGRSAHVERLAGYVRVSFEDGGMPEDIPGMVAAVPGVARVSVAWRCARDPEEYNAAAIESLRVCKGCESFKVHGRRSNTDYPIHSIDLNRQVGSALCEAFPDLRVQMHQPDVTVNVHVVQSDVYVYADATSQRGAGGLPVGTAGKVVTLLSSGFDSPVATWMVGRRGAICVPVHFSGRPMTSDESEWLTQDIVRALEPAGIIGRLYVVPFGECQREISLKAPQALRVIMYRRLMFEVAQRVAELEGAKALVTGESLGQVASQTLENITATNDVATIPVFRPLIGTDKIEIIDRAQQIGTYDISAQTAPDCCTLFMPRRPETHANLRMVREAWETFDHEAMVEYLMKNIEYVDFNTCASYRPPRELRARHRELAPAEWPGETGDVAAKSEESANE